MNDLRLSPDQFVEVEKASGLIDKIKDHDLKNDIQDSFAKMVEAVGKERPEAPKTFIKGHSVDTYHDTNIDHSHKVHANQYANKPTTNHYHNHQTKVEYINPDKDKYSLSTTKTIDPKQISLHDSGAKKVLLNGGVWVELTDTENSRLKSFIAYDNGHKIAKV